MKARMFISVGLSPDCLNQHKQYKLYSNYRVKGVLMKIGQLSKLSGCSVQTIRYYEKEGLISAPIRTEGNFRLYDEQALERLKFIKHCRSLDLTLKEINQLINLKHSPGSKCEEINDMIDTHLHLVESRINDLQRLHFDLQALRQRCINPDTVDQCGILKELSPKQ